MFTAHSDNTESAFYDNIYTQVIDDSEEAIYGFTAVFKNIDFTCITKNTAISVTNMVRELIAVLSKLRKAYVWGVYHPDTSYISRLDSASRTMQKLFLSIKAKTYRACVVPVSSNGLKFRLTQLKNKYINAINTAKKIIDTSGIGFSYSRNWWPQSSVLVGTLRNPKQLGIAISERFYHIPESLIANPSDIKCVAVYQSKNLFGSDSGIKYYGRVSDFSRIQRNEIKEIPNISHEPYVKFEIEEWKMLKFPKTADYLGDTCITTTLFQLMSCEKTSELLLSGYDEFSLYEFMKRNAFSDSAAIYPFKDGDVVYTGEAFDVLYRGRSIYKITNEHFFKSGVSAVKILAERLFSAQRQSLT